MMPSVTHKHSRRRATADGHSSGEEAPAGAGGKARLERREWKGTGGKARVERRGWKGAPPSGVGKESGTGGSAGGRGPGPGGGRGRGPGGGRERGNPAAGAGGDPAAGGVRPGGSGGGVGGRNLLWRGGRVGDVCVVSLGASLWRDGWGDAEPGWARDCGARDCAGHETAGHGTAGHETAGLRDLGPWELGAESRAGRESLGTPVS